MLTACGGSLVLVPVHASSVSDKVVVITAETRSTAAKPDGARVKRMTRPPVQARGLAPLKGG